MSPRRRNRAGHGTQECPATKNQRGSLSRGAGSPGIPRLFRFFRGCFRDCCLGTDGKERGRGGAGEGSRACPGTGAREGCGDRPSLSIRRACEGPPTPHYLGTPPTAAREKVSRAEFRANFFPGCAAQTEACSPGRRQGGRHGTMSAGRDTEVADVVRSPADHV